MPQASRDDALRILEEHHRANAGLFDRLSDEQMSARGTIGNGEWSAKDLMGHIAAWERYALETLESFRRGESAWIEAVFADKDGVDRLNDEAVARGAALSLEVVRTRSEEAFTGLIDSIRSMSDAEWDTPYETGPAAAGPVETIGAILGGITAGPPPAGPFAHVTAHLDPLRSYVESVSNRD